MNGNPFISYNGFDGIAFARQYIDTREPIQLDELFEDFGVISELEDVPTGYVVMFTAEFSKPAKLMIGRPVAKVWKAWGEYVQRGHGRLQHAIKIIAPSTLSEDLVVWRITSNTGKHALVAVTPLPHIPVPASLAGWELRNNIRSHWIDWK